MTLSSVADMTAALWQTSSFSLAMQKLRVTHRRGKAQKTEKAGREPGALPVCAVKSLPLHWRRRPHKLLQSAQVFILYLETVGRERIKKHECLTILIPLARREREREREGERSRLTGRELWGLIKPRTRSRKTKKKAGKIKKWEQPFANSSKYPWYSVRQPSAIKG